MWITCYQCLKTMIFQQNEVVLEEVNKKQQLETKEMNDNHRVRNLEICNTQASYKRYCIQLRLPLLE